MVCEMPSMFSHETNERQKTKHLVSCIPCISWSFLGRRRFWHGQVRTSDFLQHLRTCRMPIYHRMFTADDLTNRQATKRMSNYCPHDPFKKARRETGVLRAEMDGENIPLILRHKDLREATRDTATFTSDTPCRVPIPSEESVRSVRQLPLEIDPPAHTEYRALVEPFSKRPNEPEYIEKIEAIVADLL